MKFRSVLSIITAIAFLMALNGCGSSKKGVSGRKEITEPFQSAEYYSGTEYFKAVGQGTSPNLSMSKEIAETDAQENLASEIQAKVKSVAERYRQQRNISKNSEFNQKMEQLTRTVVDETLNSAKVFDRKTFQESDGEYTHYIAIRMPVDPLKRNLEDRISRDQKLRQDFEKEKFEETFNSELKEYKKEQKRGYN